MKNVSRLYRDSGQPSDTSTHQNRAANQSSISGSAAGSFSSPPLSGQRTLEEIRNLLLGDTTSTQNAENIRLNDRLDTVEKHFVAKLDEQSNEISKLKMLLQQAEHDRNSAMAELNALKVNSEAALYEMQAQHARNNEELHIKLEKRLESQTELLSLSLRQVAETISQNRS